MKPKLTLLILTILVSMAAGQTTRPAFMLGVWQQPAPTFSKWKDLGINTLVCHPEGTSLSRSAWEAEAAKAGLWFLSYGSADATTVAQEGRQPFRLGFLQPDEPDMSNHQALPGNTLKDLAAQYARYHATGLPVYQTSQGSAFDNLYYDGRKHRTDINADRPYWHAAQDGGYFAQADVIGWDYYLWSSGRPGGFDIWARLFDRVHQWSGGKPQYLAVETSLLGKPGAWSPDDLESQVLFALSYCARNGIRLHGVVYFTHKVYPGWTSFDNTDAATTTRLKELNQRLLAAANMKPCTIPAAAPVTQPVDPVAARLDLIRSDLSEIKARLDRGLSITGTATTQPTR